MGLKMRWKKDDSGAEVYRCGDYAIEWLGDCWIVTFARQEIATTLNLAGAKESAAKHEAGDGGDDDNEHSWKSRTNQF
jgi:hypothetical protein